MTIATLCIDLAKNVFAAQCYRDGSMLRCALLGKVVSAVWS